MTPSVEQIMECMENPVKAQVLLLLREKERATPKEMLAANPGLAQATLYRSLKSMQQAGIIAVASETKVRAVTEKTYAIAPQFANMENELVQNNDGAAYYGIFSAFVLDLLKKFKRYSQRESIDIAADGSSFNAFPIYATAEQLAECSRQIESILKPLAVRQSSGQQQYTLAAIVSPPIEQETEAEA